MYRKRFYLKVVTLVCSLQNFKKSKPNDVRSPRLQLLLPGGPAFSQRKWLSMVGSSGTVLEQRGGGQGRRTGNPK